MNATLKGLNLSIVETIVEPGSKDGELCVRLQVADAPIKVIDTASYHLQLLTTIPGNGHLQIAEIQALLLTELQTVIEAQLAKLKAG